MVDTPAASRMAAGLGAGVALMAAVTVAVVVLRAVFGLGWIWLQESVVYLHAGVFLFGAAVAWLTDDHVRVDVWYRKRSPRTQARINLAGSVLLLVPLCLFMFLVSLDYVAASWQRLEGSRLPGGIPAVFLLKTLIPVSALCLLAAAVWRMKGWVGELRASTPSTPSSRNRE